MNYALQDSARERQDRQAAAIAQFLIEQARAFDHVVHQRFTLNKAWVQPSEWTSVVVYPAATDGTVTSASAVLANYRTNVRRNKRKVTPITVPAPTEPYPLGLFIVELAPDEVHLRPKILAWLEAHSAAETKLWQGDVLAWITPQLSVPPKADLAFFTAPFAGLNPDLILRAPRSGWPRTAMQTTLAFAPNKTICKLSRPAPPNTSICEAIGRVDASHLQAQYLTVSTDLSASSIKTGLLYQAPNGATAKEVSAQSVSVPSIETPQLQTNSLSVTSIDASRTPPAGGYAYAASIGTLTASILKAPIVSATGTVSSRTKITADFGSAENIEQRLGIPPQLRLGTVSVPVIVTPTATTTTATVQSCTGCN